MNEIRDWVVYLTLYLGDLMPRRYIGSTYQARIDKEGYNGTVDSKDYKKIWLSERKNNPHLFKTRVLERGFPSQEAARTREGEIQRAYDVVRSDMYINKSYADGNFHSDRTGSKHTAESRKKMSASKMGNTYNADPTVHLIVQFYSILLSKIFYGTRQEMLAAIPELTQGGLNLVLSGKRQTCKEWMLPETAKNPPSHAIFYTIEHPIHGEDTGTQKQLREKHPEMSSGGLSHMLSGIYSTHKGWRLPETALNPPATISGKNHYNYDHTVRTIVNPHATGVETKEVTGTRQEMRAAIPELTRDGLNRLIRREYQTHKGWKLK
jgi:hypothetical protein